MSHEIRIGDRVVGDGHPVYVVAELSANHNGNYDTAVQLIEAAHAAGADAVKLQTYTPDTLTIDCDGQDFKIQSGSLWDGRTLYDLYAEAQTPWEWHPKLQAVAQRLGLALFSTPYDDTAVDFLERLEVPAYKIASFELVDLPLLRRVSSTGKPVIASTGMATRDEIAEAVKTLRAHGTRDIVLLKATSAYPAPPSEMQLRAIPELAQEFELPVGLSDHTPGIAVPVAAVALGACMIEKHLTLSRSVPGPDAAFSLEPDEFADMVQAVRVAEQALAPASWKPTDHEKASLPFRRSLFVVRDMKAGEPFTPENVRSIRPAAGLHTRHLEEILGSTAACDIQRGTPLGWELVRRKQ